MQIKNISLTLSFLLCLTAPAYSADVLDHPLFGKQKQEEAKVAKVLSTDTIRLENDKTIVLIGLRASEVSAPEKVEQDKYGFVIESETPYVSTEERSIKFVRDLLEGQMVQLEYDIEKTSATGTILGYVYLKDGTFVNAEILRQGFADLSIRPPNLKHAAELREAYREARQEKRGIHGE